MYVVILVHPAEAVVRNEMPFGRDTRMAPSNIVLDRGWAPGPHGDIWGSEPPVRSDIAYWPLFISFSTFS